MSISTLLRTLVTYLFIFIISLVIVPILALIALLPEKFRFNNPLYFRIIYIFYKSILFFSFLPKKISGLANLIDEPAIYVGNHQSALDIPVIGYINGLKAHTWLVLEYYAKTPILGFFVRRMTVPVNRSDKVKAGRSLLQLLKRVENYKMNVIIFPEGARHKEKKVHEFFSGFAILAQKTGLPVIPMYMPNNSAIYPVGSFLINWEIIEVKIGEPMVYNSQETIQDFTNRVRNWFVAQANN